MNLIDVDPYVDDVMGVVYLRVTDNKSGTKMQTRPDALRELIQRAASGEFAEWLGEDECGSTTGR